MKIVVLTGAGISAESGISTFRDQNGLWENHAIEDVATPQAFARNPDLVYKFYNLRRAQLLEDEIRPNLAHLALAELESKYLNDLYLVTQNVDNLHEKAGSRRVRHMHGELIKVRCQKTQKVYEHPFNLDSKSLCTCCEETGNLRPHIVWFGEMPMYMDEIFEALESSDLFISIGTSAVVYPAAMFVQVAKQAGAKCVEFNLDNTPMSNIFDECIQGKATETLPNYLKSL